MTASIYITIAVAVERYLSIRDLASPSKPFPVKSALAAVTIFSVAINAPRFFELRPVERVKSEMEVVNDTGNLLVDIVFKYVTYSLGKCALKI